MAKRYYWLKLKEDFFTQKEIKRLRRLAGGDTYTIIYLKLLLLSLKNEGKVFFDAIGDDFADELSIEIDEDVDNIKMTLSYLQQKGLLELANQDEMYLNGIKTMIGSETDSAERVRKHRRNIRIGDSKEVKALQCNTEVTKSNTEIELDKEKELNIDTEQEDKTPPPPPIDYERLQKLFNEKCISLPPVVKMTDKRKQSIVARAREYGIESIDIVIDNASKSKFMAGDNQRNWVATFDWIIKPSNYIKVMEGNYLDKGGNQNGADTKDDQYDLEKHGIGFSM